MQFRQAQLPAIASGELTVSFRRWRRPQAAAGKHHRQGGGFILIEAVDPIAEDEVTAADAKAAGHESPAAVLAAVAKNQRRNQDPDAQLYRIRFRWLGEQAHPRDLLAADADLEAAELADVVGKLRQIDSRADRSGKGAWTQRTLAAIAADPGRRAGDLAAAQNRETAKFKTDVRKLKALGLTISLETGYRLSPRGVRVLAAMESETP